ncbi:hypothetical protein CAPTEDRAFT_114249, partial [Capitella teleta]
ITLCLILNGLSLEGLLFLFLPTLVTNGWVFFFLDSLYCKYIITKTLVRSFRSRR